MTAAAADRPTDRKFREDDVLRHENTEVAQSKIRKPHEKRAFVVVKSVSSDGLYDSGGIWIWQEIPDRSSLSATEPGTQIN